MAIWRGAVLTRAGNEPAGNRRAAGKQIIFTRLVTGCGIYTEEEKDRAALANATALETAGSGVSLLLLRKTERAERAFKSSLSIIRN